MATKISPCSHELAKLQHWFASIITQPIDEQSTLPEVTPRGEELSVEAARYINPTDALKPYQRIEIYAQQYWWRLLNVMQEGFPLVVRLFGYQAFNKQLCEPYLLSYPPDHWYLSHIGNHFLTWARNHYHAEDRKLVLDSIAIDWALASAFVAKKTPPFAKEKLTSSSEALSLETLMDVSWRLQQHLHLFCWEYDLIAFRKKMLEKEVEFWEDNPFPRLEKMPKGERLRYALFQSERRGLFWEPLAPLEWWALRHFRRGCSFNALCDSAEKAFDSSRPFSRFGKEFENYSPETFAREMVQWPQRWLALRWLHAKNN